MVADIARVSYDPSRKYRAVISQQGRVTLEADNNEAAMLEMEALRLETIDIIGPLGTPDDGYKVSGGVGGITIGPGILYLGGWRLELDHKIELAKQPDGLAFATSVGEVREGNFVVSLLLTEQSVCAIEDRALREVALGGPDTAARSRLMQRFLLEPTRGDNCAGGAETILGLLAEDGVSVDPGTLQLMSTARLQAGFVPGPATTDPCTPAAAGGYLGADNQMIRVTVTEYDPASKTGRLLWAWNNASFLYRASLGADGVTVTLTDTPVDQEHAPQQKQMVEILRTATNLGDGNFIAHGQGEVRSVAQAFSFDTQQLVLDTAVTSEYLNNTAPLFVRLWHGEVAFEAGKATPLDHVSGVTVAITMDALPSHVAARPFWHFAVRPSTPQNIYPQRYTDAPQPPDGPRQWIADLAVVAVAGREWKVLSNCLVPFLPLTKQTGPCCGLVLDPEEVAGRGGLQAVVDSLAGHAAVLSLRSGTYPVSAPLTLGKQHSGLTIEGCTGDVTIAAAGADMTGFKSGLVVIDGVDGLRLQQLKFRPPEVPFVQDRGTDIATLLAVRVGTARSLTIQSCTFDLAARAKNPLGAGLAVTGATSAMLLRENTFATPAARGEMFGIVAIVSEKQASAQLDHWEIDNNRFENMVVAAFCMAQLGLVRCCENVVLSCAAGFVFAEGNLGSTSGFVREAMLRDRTIAATQSQAAATGSTTSSATNITLGQAAFAALRPDLVASYAEKLSAMLSPAITPGPTVSDVARKALAEQMKTTGTETYRKLAGSSATQQTTTTDAAAAINAPYAKNFDSIDTMAVAVELSEQVLTPTLRIEDNEITLSATTIAAWVGVSVALSLEQPGSVMVSGNRVVVPDATALCCSILMPAGAVVTGNLFVQQALPPQGKTFVASLLLLTASPAIMVAANTISFFEYILPQRSTQAATTSWEFLNTVA